ncbi:hypothetical protein AYO49_03885 [Verrucomicrobiaceae bacterium SCGC AG-212-N21]|nr:hypothetical protein AYO49_03885 [Verrucomicrobiaceae bacterium SCGC AG-212-N21]
MKPSKNRRSRRHQKASLMLEPPGPVRYITVPLVNDVPPEPVQEFTERCEVFEDQGTTSADAPAALVDAPAETPAIPVDAPPPPRWNPRWLRWATLAAIAAIITLGACLYVHTLGFPFQFDDHVYLLGSPFVTQAKDFILNKSFNEVANHSVALGLGFDPSVNFILRPIAYLSFHLNYVLANGFTPAGFRAVNIGIHCLNAVLLFLLLRHLLRHSPKAAGLPAGSVIFIPLAVSLLWVAHPLHTESVTYIVQRFTSMVCFFMLLTVLLYFLSVTAERRRTAFFLRGLAVLTAIAGMLTKESMFTVPVMIVMLHYVVMGGTLKRACWQALPLLLCMLIIPTLTLLISRAQSGSGGIAAAMQIAASSKDPAYQYHYFLTQLGVILEYVRLLVWPQGLNIDRQYQLATSFLQLRVWLSFLVIIGILVAAWRHFRMNRNNIRHVLIAAGVFWFFLRLAVTSSFVPLDDLMVDHRTYGASMGLMLVLVCALDLARTGFPKPAGVRWTAPAALAAWVALLSAATLNRNEVWQSETSLWSDTVLKSPNKARPWDNLGVCHYMAGREDEAIACLMKSATLNPQHLPAYIKLGVIFNAKGKYGDAAEWSNKGLDRFPDAAVLYYNRGVALCGLGMVTQGKEAMELAVKYQPTHSGAHAALGQIHRHLGQNGVALKHYRKAASLGVNDPNVVGAITDLEALVAPQAAQN